MPGPTGAKLPISKDTFNISAAAFKDSVANLKEQQISPLSTLKKIQYDAIFARKDVTLGERIAEVIAVNLNVKRPSELAYFGDKNLSDENGSRDWVVAICRIPDFDASTPAPSMAVNPDTAKSSFQDLNRIRQHGKFYVSSDELRGKGYTNIEVGDWLVVEYQDKTILSNGIIKDVYYKKDLSTMSEALKEEAETTNQAAASGAFDRPGALPGSLALAAPTTPVFINPVANAGYRISSKFGMRLHPIQKVMKQHNGIDIAAPAGVPYYAMEEGVVEQIKNDSSNGNGVLVKHTGNAKGYTSLGIHLLKPPSVRKGETVRKGQLLGYIGNSGASKGNHLHLQITKDGSMIDPATVVDFTPWVPGAAFGPDQGTPQQIDPDSLAQSSTVTTKALGPPVSKDESGNCYDVDGNLVPCPEPASSAPAPQQNTSPTPQQSTDQ